MHEQSVEAPLNHRPPDDDGAAYLDQDAASRRARQGAAESVPPRMSAGSQSTSLGAALRRYPLVALLPVVVLVAAGVTLGLRRPPIYTASTQANVGVPDINSQATPGYVEAELTLASAYSREVTSQYVFNPVAKRMGVSPSVIASRLSSSAVPNSPTFTINATGPSPRSAIQLAATATTALQQKINQLDQGEDGSAALLNKFRRAQGRADALTARSGALRAQQALGTGNVSTKSLQNAKVASQVAQLQAQALAAHYTNSNMLSRGAIIDVLNPATSATSDRNSITERYALIGLAAGVIMGAALAFLVYRVRRRPADRRL